MFSARRRDELETPAGTASPTWLLLFDLRPVSLLSRNAQSENRHSLERNLFFLLFLPIQKLFLLPQLFYPIGMRGTSGSKFSSQLRNRYVLWSDHWRFSVEKIEKKSPHRPSMHAVSWQMTRNGWGSDELRYRRAKSGMKPELEESKERTSDWLKLKACINMHTFRDKHKLRRVIGLRRKSHLNYAFQWR